MIPGPGASKLPGARRDFAGIFSTESRECTYPPGVAEVIIVKSSWRRTLLFACVGTTLGFAAALVRGPQLVSFFFKPLQASLSCAPTVDTALNQFVGLELVCAALGAVLTLAALFFWRRFMRQRAEARQGRSAR
jgi:hypothetical protein